jgi:opacity protein-like surface antigen
VASIRGRIGWATEHVLLYATTGVAFARNDSFKGNVSVGRGGTGSDGEDGDPFRQVALACTTLRLGIRRGERSRMVCAASSMLAFPLRERVTME